MLELIRLFPEDDHTAGILLDGEYERFNLNLRDWTKKIILPNGSMLRNTH